jgi:hypothetical protein
MPRANCHFLPGQVWRTSLIYATAGFQSFQSFNRCAPFKRSKRSSVQRFKVKICLTFAAMYLRWLFEVQKRFGLSVLNYR